MIARLVIISMIINFSTSVELTPRTYDRCQENVIAIANQAMTIGGNFYKRSQESGHKLINFYEQALFLTSKVFNIIEYCANQYEGLNTTVQRCLRSRIVKLPNHSYEKIVNTITNKNVPVGDKVRYFFDFASSVHVAVERCIDRTDF